jgi:hypothetical protein
MINNADVIERLGSLVGRELTNVTLHEVIFCEDKHKKILVRFNLGKHIYIHYKINKQNSDTYADILISGNPNTFRIGVEEKDGSILVISAPRVSYQYL